MPSLVTWLHRVPCATGKAAPVGVFVVMTALGGGPVQGQVKTERASMPATVVSATAEQQLQAIRDALLQSALSAQTRVKSVSWINEQGQLLESSQFTSDVKVRGVQVLEYLQGDGEPMQARLKANVQAPPRECHGNSTPALWTHPLRVQMSWSVPQGPGLRSTALQALQVMEHALMRQMTQRHPQVQWDSPHRFDPVLASAYERAVYGRAQPQHPMTLQVSVRALEQDFVKTASGQSPLSQRRAQGEWETEAPAGAARGAAARKLASQVLGFAPQVDLAIDMVLGREGEAEVWRSQSHLRVDEPRGGSRLGVLEADHQRALQALVQSQWQQIDQVLRCEPLSFEARHTGDQRWELLAGANAHLRPGDRMVIADAQRVPRRILEPAAVEHLAIAEVTAVSSDRAEMRQVAGPALRGSGRWLALPF